MDMERKKPVYSEAILGQSPFVNSLVIPATKLPKSEYIQDSDGDIIPKDVWVERIPYVKLFIVPEHRHFTNNLSDKGRSLFMWVLHELEHGHDYLWINKKRYMKENSIKSYNTYANAIKELVRYGFLAYTTVKDVFWINPNFAYRGNRIKRFKDNVKQIGE